MSEIETLLKRLAAWVERRPDASALALVGSWARDAQHGGSDVDLVLLSSDPSRYTERDDWLEELAPARLVRTLSWGAVTERRLALPSGLEVELGIGPLSWSSVDPIDPGTRKVVSDGIGVLYDRDGRLAELVAAC